MEYAEDIKKVVKCPLLVTGGFRSSSFMKEVLEKKQVDLIGLGRSLCIDPSFSASILSGADVTSPVQPLSSGIKTIDTFFPLEIIWYTEQIHRMGKGKRPNPQASVYSSIINMAISTGMQMFKKVRGNV